MAFRSTSKLLTAAIVLGIAPLAGAQGFGLGKAPTAEEVRKWDIAIGPDGKELPAGRGTAKEGAPIYMQKCSGCHGQNGEGGRAPTLVLPKGTPPPRGVDMGLANPGLMAAMTPYATVMWDFINRGMPLGREGSLTPNEVYSLTAWMLHKYNLVTEEEVLDEKTLPKVKMPTEIGFVPPSEEHHKGKPRVAGYPGIGR